MTTSRRMDNTDAWWTNIGADRVVRPYDGNTVYYFLKLSFRETERLKTMWSAVLSRLSRQK